MHHDPVRQSQGLGFVVSDQHDGSPGFADYSFHVVYDGLPGRGVQGGERLIEE